MPFWHLWICKSQVKAKGQIKVRGVGITQFVQGGSIGVRAFDASERLNQQNNHGDYLVQRKSSHNNVVIESIMNLRFAINSRVTNKHFVGRVKGECVLHFGMCSGYYFLLGLPQPRMNVMNNLSSNPCGRGNLRELITNVSIYSGHSVAEGRVASLMIRRWATEKAAGSSKKWS
ncbi:hypothetical protein MKW98_001978 [Papaver atlanticum]|uniref:Uncharacterized protein n=1 Tax=Papaver atlanticum TaxID=357466 RepID=A0AAD4SQ88_9MAGN|nr:hypothetical protein MKW98_001978 [Papaver atlanticum]